jgi:hypothetical protein
MKSSKVIYPVNMEILVISHVSDISSISDDGKGDSLRNFGCWYHRAGMIAREYFIITTICINVINAGNTEEIS